MVVEEWEKTKWKVLILLLFKKKREKKKKKKLFRNRIEHILVVVVECGKTRWKVLIKKKIFWLFRNRIGRTHPGGGGGVWKDEVEGVNLKKKKKFKKKRKTFLQ